MQEENKKGKENPTPSGISYREAQGGPKLPSAEPNLMVNMFHTCVTPASIAFAPAGKEVVAAKRNSQAAELCDQLLDSHHMHKQQPAAGLRTETMHIHCGTYTCVPVHLHCWLQNAFFGCCFLPPAHKIGCKLHLATKIWCLCGWAVEHLHEARPRLLLLCYTNLCNKLVCSGEQKAARPGEGRQGWGPSLPQTSVALLRAVPAVSSAC